MKYFKCPLYLRTVLIKIAPNWNNFLFIFFRYSIYSIFSGRSPLTTPAIFLFFLGALGFIPLNPFNSPCEARVYQYGNYLFDIHCVNKSFDYINPTSYHLGLRVSNGVLSIRTFVEGFKIKRVNKPLFKGVFQYEFTIQMEDPEMTLGIADWWGNSIIGAYLNEDQSLGYGGDYFGFLAYIPKKTFPNLTKKHLYLSRGFGPKFKDIKSEFTEESEFFRVMIAVRRLDLWDDSNKIILVIRDVVENADGERVHFAFDEVSQFSDNLDTLNFPPEIQGLFKDFRSKKLVLELLRGTSLSDFKICGEKAAQLIKVLSKEKEDLWEQASSSPLDKENSIHLRLKDLQGDLQNLKRVFRLPPILE